MSKVAIFCILLALLPSIYCDEEVDNPWGKRVLAVLESSDVKGTHSIFFKSLEGY